MGSCFAQNIGRRLKLDGYNVLGGEIPPGSLRNRYTPAAIWQELDWAARIFDRDDTPSDADIAPLLLEVSPGLWVDMWSRYNPADTALPYDAALAQRRELYDYVRGALIANVAVITLGHIEAWWDDISSSYVDFWPGWVRLADRHRFHFERLDTAACRHYLDATMKLLAERGSKVLLTTSPVVLARTFTDDDVIIANSHSKAVLRAVSGEIAEQFANVDYFPSYEIATMTRRPEVWDDDLIHINPGFVARIMEHVTQEYVPGSRNDKGRELLHLVNLVDGLQFDDALAIYEIHAPAIGSSDDPMVQAAALRLLMALGRMEEALPFALTLADSDPVLFTHYPHWMFDAGRVLAAEPAHAVQGEALLAAVMERGLVHPKLLMNMVVNYEHRRDAAGLDAMARQVEMRDPGNVFVVTKLAAHLQTQGEIARAQALCARQRLQTPNNNGLLARIARLALATGALEAARDALQRLAELDPADEWALFVLARTLVKLGRVDEALGVLASLLAMAASHAQGLSLIARLQWKRGLRSEAIANAQAASAAAHGDAALLEPLATILAAAEAP